MPVVGESSCPSAREVARYLEQLSPASGLAFAAHLAPLGDGVLIELRDAEGAIVAVRNLVAKGTCGELARASAVAIAAWEAELKPGQPMILELPPAQLVVQAPPPPPAAPLWRFAIGAGLHRSLAGRSHRPHGCSGPSEPPRARGGSSSPVSLPAPIGSRSPQERPSGSVFHWAQARSTRSRPARSAGNFTLRRRRRCCAWPARALTLMSAPTGFDFGAALGLRASVGRWRLRPWLNLGVLGWFRRQILTVQGDTENRLELPHVELLVLGGVSLEPQFNTPHGAEQP